MAEQRSRSAAGRGWAAPVLAAAALTVLLATGARAQADSTQALVPSGPADVPRVVIGRVERPSGKGVAGVAGVEVVLHRVGSDTAGPIDSVRTSANGAYTFHYTLSGRRDAVYFASASYAGIAYFSLPFITPRVVGDSAAITVFDTTSAPVPLRVQGHHIIVAAPDADGSRDVVEVYELSNDSSVTRISPDDAHPTWTAVLPAGAIGFVVGQSDVSPRAIRDDSGRVITVAPFAPGLKQVSWEYHIPQSALPLAFPVTQDVSVLEVLTEEPHAVVDAPRIKRVAPVTIENRPYDRYLAQDVPAGAVIRIDVTAAGAARLQQRWLIGVAVAIAVAMAAALVLVLAGRGRGAPARAAPVGTRSPSARGDADRLAREIAQLDAEFERQTDPGDGARAQYAARRAELKRALARALDARRGGS